MKSFIYTFFLFLMISTQVPAGNEGPNGGDPFAQEFVALGKELILELDKSDYSTLLEGLRINKKELKKLILTDAKVFSKENVYLQDQTEVSAINYIPRKMIIIGSQRWSNYTIVQKLSLVLHEYLSLLKLEINRYNISIEFYMTFDKIKKRMIKNRSQEIKYFDSVIAPRPLYDEGLVCNLYSDSVKKAKMLSATNAINKCIVDTQLNCRVSGHNVYVVNLSKNHFWLTSCKVETIVAIDKQF